MINNKVIWSEGMLMQPHHFQQWDRYYENTLTQRLHALFQYPWGVNRLEIDKEMIENGSFSLVSFSGILSDGLPVSLPDNDEPPPVREFKPHFTSAKDILSVYLVTPTVKPGRQTCSLEKDIEGKKETRFKQTFINNVDENTGQNDQEIAIAQKRLEIRFEGEEMDDYLAIKIAEIIRSQTSAYSLREQYIPPSISLSSCHYLKNTAVRFYEKLCSKSAALSERRGERSTGMSEFGESEISNLWILYTVNSHIPILKHICQSPKIHPETLYCHLARLTGELMTFSPESSPKDSPEYHHENLFYTFSAIEKNLDNFLQVIISSNFVPIPLSKSRENIFVGQITDERLMDTGKIYLSIGGDFPADEIIEKIPRIVKVSSSNNIDIVINAGMTGVRINHIIRPPSAIPVKMGQQYFQLENFGEHWEGIKESRTVAIYLPSTFRGAKLELIAIKE